MAMIIKSGLDPIKDLKSIRLTGSHTNSLNALSEGHVQAAAASFSSFEKAVKAGAIDPSKFKPLVKSDPIPNPPLALNLHCLQFSKLSYELRFMRCTRHQGLSLV